MIKLIVSDMDGTLLNSCHELPKDFMSVFEQLQQRGIYFCAASGRQYLSLLQFFSPVKDRMAFISENGAFVNVNGEEIADKMMKASEYIDHVYPGADTRRYINRIVLRLTVFGTLYLILFTALPFSLLLWDKDLLRLTMIPGTFLMFVGMIYNIREEIRALRVNQRYTRIF